MLELVDNKLCVYHVPTYSLQTLDVFGLRLMFELQQTTTRDSRGLPSVSKPCTALYTVFRRWVFLQLNNEELFRSIINKNLKKAKTDAGRLSQKVIK